MQTLLPPKSHLSLQFVLNAEAPLSERSPISGVQPYPGQAVSPSPIHKNSGHINSSVFSGFTFCLLVHTQLITASNWAWYEPQFGIQCHFPHTMPTSPTPDIRSLKSTSNCSFASEAPCHCQTTSQRVSLRRLEEIVWLQSTLSSSYSLNSFLFTRKNATFFSTR